MSAFHLIKRFFGSLSGKALGSDDETFARANLLPSEVGLWQRMSTPDQRHACAVARRVLNALGEEATRPVIAAALLHDIGKVDADIGTFLRVIATFVGTGSSRQQIDSWATEDGWLGRAGRYLRHNEIGADMLREAGSDPITVAWAREHELKHTEWTLPEKISDALWRADSA